MEYKYTIRDFSELKEKFENSESQEEAIELLKQSDLLSRILIIDEFYNDPDPRALDIAMGLLVSLKDPVTILMFGKHIGLDYEKASENPEELKPNYFLGIFNLEKHVFDTKLINTVKKFSQPNPNILRQISEKYHKLVINNIDDFIRQYIYLNHKSNAFATVSDLLKASDLTASQKQMVFDKVLSKNEFASFDYDALAEDDFTPFTEIRGLFNKLSSKATAYVLSPSYAIQLMDKKNIPSTEIGSTMINNMLKVVRCNKESPEDIQKLFMKIEFARSKDTKSLLKALESDEEYLQAKDTVNYAMNKNFIERIKARVTKQQQLPEKVSNKILTDLLNGKRSLEFETFSTEFAKTSTMQKNYQQLLDVLINKPLDDDTKKLLATSLLVGLSERLKKEWNLDYEFVFNDTEMENNNLGSYDHRNKQLYFNKYFIYEQKDWKKGFVQGVDTIFHELKHAQQFQHDISKKEWNYDIIQQSMDHYMANQMLNQRYYRSNYHYISYEADARAESYVNTMNFFEGYEEFQDIARQELEEDIDTVRLRCREGYEMQYFQGFDFLLGTFIKSVNYSLSGHALSSAEEDKNNPTKPLDEIYEKYPSLQLIFNYNSETNEIELKSEEYFQSKLAEFKRNPEQNSEAIYCIENILYDKSVKDKFTEYNTDEFIYGEDEQERQASINEMFNAVSKEIPKPPERRMA